MGCIIRTDPDIQQLLKESGLTPLAFEIKLDEWFKNTQSDSLPTVEQLNPVTIDPILEAENLLTLLEQNKGNTESFELSKKCR